MQFSDGAKPRAYPYDSGWKTATIFPRRLLAHLPPAQRQLIDLRYTGGHAIESISQIIGRPQASICQTLYRIRQSLLACIESKLEADGGLS